MSQATPLQWNGPMGHIRGHWGELESLESLLASFLVKIYSKAKHKLHFGFEI
jgi:hypothetical protein